jgi:hypothetical protein
MSPCPSPFPRPPRRALDCGDLAPLFSLPCRTEALQRRRILPKSLPLEGEVYRAFRLPRSMGILPMSPLLP